MCLLKNCSKDALEDISDQKSCLSFRKGDYLMKEGEHARGFYCVRTGVVKTEIQNNQRNLIIGLHGKGTIFGQRIIGERGKDAITVRAVEDSEACYISAEKFLKLTARHPSLKMEMMKSLAAELQHLEKHTLHMVYRSVKERVAAALIHIAGIYQYSRVGHSIHIHLDRQDIADLTGTTKEQISHILAEFKQAGLINFRARHFKYFDLEGLRKVGEGSAALTAAAPVAVMARG